MSRKVSLAELGERDAGVSPFSEQDRELGAVEQVRDLESSVPGPPGQLCGLDRRGQRLADVVRLQEDAQEQLAARLLQAGTGCFGESHLASGQDDGFPVTPETEERARSGADGTGEQLGVVEALGEDEGRFGPLQCALG